MTATTNNRLYQILVTSGDIIINTPKLISNITANSSEDAMATLHSLMKKNQNTETPKYRAELIAWYDKNEFVKQIGVKPVSITFTPEPEKVESSIEARLPLETPPDYENLAKLLRDNGYSVRKKPNKTNPK